MNYTAARPFPLELLAGEPVAPGNAIFVGNFGSEKFWEPDNGFKISLIEDESSKVFTDYCDELEIYLAHPEDMVILRESPDKTFAAYLIGMGITLPNIEVINESWKDMTLTELVLKDEALLKRLKLWVEKKKAYGDVYLVPFSVTECEARLAEQIGARLIISDSPWHKQLNNKLYVRQLAEENGFQVTEGDICHDINGIREAYLRLSKKFRAVVLKEPCGAGGKGMLVAKDEETLRRITHIISKHSDMSDREVLVEGWYDAKHSLNCQFIIGENITPYICGKQIIQDGIFIGSLLPADEAVEASELVRHMESAHGFAALLFKLGYRGIAGIDTLTSMQGHFFPVIEVNARFNTSTLFYCARSLIGTPAVIVCRYYEFNLKNAMTFEQLVFVLGEEHYSRKTKNGYFILNFSMLNINVTYDMAHTVRGRVFVLIAGNSEQEVTDLSRLLSERVAAYNRCVMSG